MAKKKKRNKKQRMTHTEKIPTKIVVIPRYGSKAAENYKPKTFSVSMLERSDEGLKRAYLNAMAEAIEYQELLGGKSEASIIKRGIVIAKDIRCN